MIAVTASVWLFLDRFGGIWRNAFIAGSAAWLFIFGILWLGLYNMNLATLPILAVALPLSWFEFMIAALIVKRVRDL